MPIALNLTLPLKQDRETQQSLKMLAEKFAHEIQPIIDDVLSRSRIVHFARVLIIDNKYLQVLTEFDGDPLDYTEFFRTKLGGVFEKIFALVEGAPPWEELNEPQSFFTFTHGCNLQALGKATDTNYKRGYLFSAFGDLTVEEMESRMKQAAAPNTRG